MPKKYEWIRAPLKKARHDVRPESFNPQIEQIKIGSYVSTEREWRPRWEILRPLLQPSMCGMQRKCEENGSPTLGFFKPKISRLLIESASPNWTQAQQEILSQTSMLYDLPATPLEKIPFDFKYEFRCSDPGCKGHTMRCTDWEIGEAYRQWRRQYGDDWELGATVSATL